MDVQYYDETLVETHESSRHWLLNDYGGEIMIALALFLVVITIFFSFPLL
jgi:hypothetical protein